MERKELEQECECILNQRYDLALSNSDNVNQYNQNLVDCCFCRFNHELLWGSARLHELQNNDNILVNKDDTASKIIVITGVSNANELSEIILTRRTKLNADFPNRF